MHSNTNYYTFVKWQALFNNLVEKICDDYFKSKLSSISIIDKQINKYYIVLQTNNFYDAEKKNVLLLHIT